MNNNDTCEQKRLRPGRISPSPDQVVRYGVGLDVHKHVLACCVSAQIRTGEIIAVKIHSFRVSPAGLHEFTNFLQKFRPLHCCLMECTGVYHIPVYHHLQKCYQDTTTRIIAMNPLLLNRRLTDLGTKEDKADARGLASLSLYDQLLRPSYVGDLAFIRLRDSIRSYHRTRIKTTQLINRMKALLDGENLKYAFNFKKEWVLKLLDCFLSHDCTLEEAFQKRIASQTEHGRSITILEMQCNTLGEYATFRLNPRTRFLLSLRFGEYLYVDTLAARYLQETEKWVLQHSGLADAYVKLRQIPAMGSVAALTTLAELGDYFRFASWKALAKYSGVTPTIAQSGEQKSKGHINRFTNPHLRRVFVQMAGILINISKKDNDLARFAALQYKQKQLPYKKAMVKIANKIAKTVYNVLVLDVPYDPNHEYTLKRQKKVKLTLKTKNTLLEPMRTRALRRDIQGFLVTNSQYLNSTSRYHLVSGFQRLIKKSKWTDELD
ncbi:IS110 family transposase [Candidatus Lokiarchaeum ossiferum]|uniref:IS110 family transposase n=2 Tax=Candidatus Lokiarchaeum ossiferum TaxID=2951803 RepID=UPI00352E840B